MEKYLKIILTVISIMTGTIILIGMIYAIRAAWFTPEAKYGRLRDKQKNLRKELLMAQNEWIDDPFNKKKQNRLDELTSKSKKLDAEISAYYKAIYR